VQFHLFPARLAGLWGGLEGEAHMTKPFSTLIGVLLATLGCMYATALGAPAIAAASGGGQVVSYRSEITVNRNDTLLVREAILVSATDPKLFEKIHRDFPSLDHDRFGNVYPVHLEVTSLALDEQPEDYHLEKLPDGLRVCLGKRGASLSPGEHKYVLTYTLNRALGFFSDHDELYWNVTGSGWTFPIQEVSASVHLPAGIARAAVLLDAYTGLPGSARSDYSVSFDAQGNAKFRTTRPLAPPETLTIVVRWPKGFVRLPNDDENYQYFLEDNQVRLLGTAGLLLVLVYYTVAWFLGGRRRAAGLLMPRNSPPRGFSPAAVRYLWRRYFDQKALVVDLVDLAVKRRIAILEDGAGTYILGRLKAHLQPTDTAPLRAGGGWEPLPTITADQKLVLRKLFTLSGTIRLEHENYDLVGGALEALHRDLYSHLEWVYFLKNSSYLVPGLLISLLCVVRSGFAVPGASHVITVIVTAGLLIWSLACAALAVAGLIAWRNVISDPQPSAAAWKQALTTTGVAIAVFGGEIVGLGVVAWATSGMVALLLVLQALFSYTFHCLLKLSGRSGRPLQDQIEAFRMFLTEADKDRYKVLVALPKTPAVFEKFLPYALALNVERAWSEKFAAVLAQAARPRATSYSPTWYSGRDWNPGAPLAFATALGSSFSRAIASASAPPGSSTKRP
jgi:hypothetical protein